MGIFSSAGSGCPICMFDFMLRFLQQPDWISEISASVLGHDRFFLFYFLKISKPSNNRRPALHMYCGVSRGPEAWKPAHLLILKPSYKCLSESNLTKSIRKISY